MVANNRFTRFACVDWSGAAVARPPGIAVAIAEANGETELIRPTHRWSRADVLEWLLEIADADTDIIIGFDLSFGFPFIDAGRFFPEWDSSPPIASDLWALVEEICADDPHMSAQSFLDHAQGRRHFRHKKDEVGDLFTDGIGRLRVVESHQRTTKQANSWSCFNLVGAGQVGKSSLTGMRMLHQLAGRIPVWPFDPVPDSGPVIVEIYTSMAARATGMAANRSKMRDAQSRDTALATLDAYIARLTNRVDDHANDALLTAAWLRQTANNQHYWHPEPINQQITQTEGWTFGVV